MNVKNVKKSTGRVGGQFGNTNAEKWTEKKALKIGNDLIKWLNEDDNVFFEEFLQSKKLYRDLTAYLSEKYQSFSDLIKKAKEIQELKLVKGMSNKKIIVPAAIFVLKNHHGYKDRVEHTGNMQSGINFQLIPRKSKKKK